MDDREFERALERLMKQDLSAGTDAFRDSLLNRCLAVLDKDNDGVPIEDSHLELLAAAGSPDVASEFSRRNDKWE